MKHLDLFSGIGGFALAADAVWPSVEHTFVEIDPFCQAVLKKHWPESKIYEDVVGSSFPPGAFLLTAGTPCQPASSAGRRRGTEDSRWLWDETVRVIHEVRPRNFILENVPGLLTIGGGLDLEQICVELEYKGYEMQTFVLPACALGAPHRRDRVWIVGHTDDYGRDGSEDPEGDPAGKYRYAPRQDEVRQPARPVGTWDISQPFKEDWETVADRTCLRPVHDGVPRGLVGRHRDRAIKAAGNAIVPAVAIEIMRAIYETHS